MTFLVPTYLWSLLGLAVPLAIHLWSRKKVKVIKVGSTKFLESLDPKQTSSVKLNELLLLLMRMLGIALLVFILAEPRLKKDAPITPITYLVEPSLLDDSRMITLLDSLPENAIRLLQSGFPDWDRSEGDDSNGETPEYWQLAQKMESLPTDSIVVFTKAFQKGIQGMRPEISVNVKWVLFEPDETVDEVVEAASSEDEVSLLRLTGNQRNLSFIKEVVPFDSEGIIVNTAKDSIAINSKEGKKMLPLAKNEPIVIKIVYEDSLTDQMQYLESTFRAIGKYLNRQLVINSEKMEEVDESSYLDYLVWLSEESVPDNIRKVLLYHPDSLAEQLIEPAPGKNTFHLTRNLNAENIIKENFAQQLTAMLDLHPDLDEKMVAYDIRTVALNELRPNKSALTRKQDYSQLLDLSPWLWGILAVLLVVERIMAKYRKQ